MTNNIDPMDKEVEAVCGCGYKKIITFRNLKNRWPRCKRCNLSMKVKKDAISSV